MGARREVSMVGAMVLRKLMREGVEGDFRRLVLMSRVRKEDGSGGSSPRSFRMDERSAEVGEVRLMWEEVRVRLYGV